MFHEKKSREMKANVCGTNSLKLYDQELNAKNKVY